MKITDKPQRHPDATYQTVGEESIIIKLSTGDYYSLNDTGTMFWELLNGDRTIADCAQAIAAEYDAPPGDVQSDLLELAAEFAVEGLIVV